MNQKQKTIQLTDLRRNGALVDVWSFVHLLTGVAMGWVMDPWVAFGLMVLWEPFEIFFLSPILARRGLVFGHESLRNSMSDIVFDGLGVLIGYLWLSMIISPPFILFT